MQLVSYNRQQLSEFINSDQYRRLKNIPISYHRAISHIHNPLCSEDDILLWVIYEEDLLIGYAGVLPAQCLMGGVTRKIYWLSCFWADEHHRKRNVASMLFFQLVKRYKEQLCITNFVPSLEKTYSGLGIFHPVKIKTGYRFYMNSCTADLFLSRFPGAMQLAPLFRLTDKVIDVVLKIRTLLFHHVNVSSGIDESPVFDSAFQHFLDTFQVKEDPFKKDAGFFTWILSYPWVLQGIPDEESRRYYFSSVSEQFVYVPVKIYRDNRLHGFALLKIRNKILTVSYIYAYDDVIDELGDYLLQKAHQESIKTITTFDHRLAMKLKKHRVRYILKKSIRRSYLVAKKISLSEPSFQEGEGDAVFT